VSRRQEGRGVSRWGQNTCCNMYVCVCVCLSNQNWICLWYVIFMYRVHCTSSVHWGVHVRWKWSFVCVILYSTLALYMCTQRYIHMYMYTDSLTFCIGYMTYMHVHMLDSLTST
jgi:hypothetical protein